MNKNYRKVQKQQDARKVLISSHFLTFETQPKIWDVTKSPPLQESRPEIPLTRKRKTGSPHADDFPVPKLLINGMI